MLRKYLTVKFKSLTEITVVLFEPLTFISP